MMEITYEEVCGVWARADHWPLEDAIRLLMKQFPKSLAPFVQGDTQLEYKLKFELATNCLGGSLPFVDVDLGDEPRVSPVALMDWADLKQVRVPEELRAAINHVSQRELSAKGKPRPSQRHKERCRGIAALLWKQDPDIKIAAMAARPEFIKIGCEGTFYSEKTIYHWIKSESGNHKPGRPKKDKTTA